MLKPDRKAAYFWWLPDVYPKTAWQLPYNCLTNYEAIFCTFLKSPRVAVFWGIVFQGVAQIWLNHFVYQKFNLFIIITLEYHKRKESSNFTPIFQQGVRLKNVWTHFKTSYLKGFQSSTRCILRPYISRCCGSP